ncbi:MAG: hypothetical protein LBV69_04895 [Bacteroidales bacterium]|jgi:hypothetical protein|nr:hypothetical protein [Bacteroidales bacterium]
MAKITDCLTEEEKDIIKKDNKESYDLLSVDTSDSEQVEEYTKTHNVPSAVDSFLSIMKSNNNEIKDLKNNDIFTKYKIKYFIIETYKRDNKDNPEFKDLTDEDIFYKWLSHYHLDDWNDEMESNSMYSCPKGENYINEDYPEDEDSKDARLFCEEESLKYDKDTNFKEQWEKDKEQLLEDMIMDE